MRKTEPISNEKLRQKMGRAAIKAAKAVSYFSGNSAENNFRNNIQTMNDGQNKEELLPEIKKAESQIARLNEYKRELACQLQNLSQEDIVEQQNPAVLSVQLGIFCLDFFSLQG